MHSTSTGTKRLNELNLEWSYMRSLRESTSPSQLCPSDPTPSNPRLAKDFSYAKAVLDAWKSDENTNTDTIGARLPYKRESDDKTLYGYIVANEDLIRNNNIERNSSIPVVILFHTGAGPSDVFLRWKADMLVKDDMWGENGCVVFIADILSDEEGWTWDDRDKYDRVRADLLEQTIRDNKKNPQRWKLRETITAIMTLLNTIGEIDCQRIGAMGWCLGGHSILEMGRMNISGVRAMVTFHGVFDGVHVAEEQNEELSVANKGVVICNGLSDPFVSNQSLELGIQSFKQNSWNVELLQFEGVKHGFTNPAQNFNENESFAFDEDGASTSWRLAKALLMKYLRG